MLSLAHDALWLYPYGSSGHRRLIVDKIKIA